MPALTGTGKAAAFGIPLVEWVDIDHTLNLDSPRELALAIQVAARNTGLSVGG
jgi:superfamily II DNA/RNA helicase